MLVAALSQAVYFVVQRPYLTRWAVAYATRAYVLGERPGAVSLLGGGMALAGVGLVSARDRVRRGTTGPSARRAGSA